MKCPVCPDATLHMSERQGVEIDYCPACRGIWLDRGELDKLLQMSNNQSQPQSPPPRQYADEGRYRDNNYPHSDKYHHSGGYRKRKSWLEEIFD
jgi:uncharacterized protein